MVSFAYFANCLSQDVGVNLNASTINAPVAAMAGLASAPYSVLTVRSGPYPSSANSDKDQFGASTGVTNKVLVFYTDESSFNEYKISFTTSRTGMNLYFFIFVGQLVGIDQYGSSEGIVIETVVPEKKTIQ